MKKKLVWIVRTVWLLLIILHFGLELPKAQTPSSGSPLGEMIKIGGHKLHIHCSGPDDATPTIIFESGGGGDSKDWIRVRELLPPYMRTCAYDRAGSGWSEAGPEPRTMQQEVFELHELLKAKNITGPIVLVGQSIGGLLVRLYTEQYGGNVVGIVLVDPTHESSVLGSSRYGGMVRLREKATGIPLPEPRLEGNAVSSPQFIDYWAEEFQLFYLRRIENPKPFGDRPLIVLGAGKRPAPPGITDEVWKELKNEKEEQVQDQAGLSRNAKFILDPTSGHSIHLDNPQLVADAIEEVLEAVYKGLYLNH